MLRNEIKLSDLMGITFGTAGDYCEQLLTAKRLKTELESSSIRRKDLCEFLGIGESTLTGWLQSGRIPRMAAEAYVLFLARQTFAQEIRRLEVELERANDIRVVAIGEKFGLVQFDKKKDGELVGRIVADNMANYGVARSLAEGTSKRLVERMKSCVEFADQYADQLSVDRGAAELEASVKRVIDEIEEEITLLIDYESWRKQYHPTVDDLIVSDKHSRS